MMIDLMSDAEILKELGSDSLLNQVRRKFYHGAALIEQKMEQRKPPSVFEIRRLEFQLAAEIIEIVKQNS